MSRPDRPAKTPIVPEWCDCNGYSIANKVKFIGVLRAVITLMSFTMCVAFLGIYETLQRVQCLLGIIITLNLIHFFVTVYYLSLGKGDNPRVVKRWFQIDMVITGIFVVLVLVLLFSIPADRLHLILGVKLIALSLFLCYRYTMAYIQLLDVSPQSPA